MLNFLYCIGKASLRDLAFTPPHPPPMKNMCLTAIIGLLCLAPVFAQETTQVSIVGIPPILPSPYFSDLENNYHQGQYHVQLTYSSNRPDGAKFVWEVRLTKDGREMLHISSDVIVYTPGTYYYRSFEDEPRVSFPRDLYDYFDAWDMERIIRAGVLSEGSYVLEIELRPADPFDMIQSIPGFAHFEVRYPQPPILVTPPDGQLAPPWYGVFSWTPVLAPPGVQFEYDILIVEMLEGQTSPQKAIEANIPHVEHTTTQPLFIHTPVEQEFELDRTYVWQVQARDAQGLIPIADDGYSEIFTFKVAHQITDINLNELERIQLIPGFAEVVYLHRLEAIPGRRALTVDGEAILRLYMPTTLGGTIEIPIKCMDLELAYGSRDMAVAIGGEVAGKVETAMFPYPGVDDIIFFDEINWSLARGVTLNARIIDPRGNFLRADGRLNLTPAGLSGMLTATGPRGAPLFSFEEHPVELSILSLTAQFPQGRLGIDAQLRLFGKDTPCQLHHLEITRGSSAFSFECMVNTGFPLVPGQDLAKLFLSQAFVNLELDYDTRQLDFAIKATGALHLHAEGAGRYALPAWLSLSSSDGVHAQLQLPSIIANRPPIELGVGQIIIQRMDKAFLEYDLQTRQWDFGISLDAELVFPAFDHLQLPGVSNVLLDREGIHFPKVHFDREDLAWVPQLELGGFGARLLSFTLQDFTFPWFAWDRVSAGPWMFSFGFDLLTPHFGSHLPECLRSLRLRVEEATFSEGSFMAEMPATSFEEGQCRLPLGGGYGLSLHSLGGFLGGTYDAEGLSIRGQLMLDGALHVGAPFVCDGSPEETLIAIERLGMDSHGLLQGRISADTWPCPFEIGPFRGGIGDASMEFRVENEQQLATLYAGAYLHFPVQGGQTNRVAGALGVDLMSGELILLDFQIDEPFIWDIPREEPVLSFRIARAGISQRGIHVDGMQTFLLGNQEMEVAFRNVLFDLRQARLLEGDITFGGLFALEVGIDRTDMSIHYQAVPYDAEPTLDPGLLFRFDGRIVIDSTGLRTAGQAKASLRFPGLELPSLNMRFSEDFAFGLDPFGVNRGQAEIIHDNTIVAVIDPQGFHLLYGLENIADLLPSHLPLPSHHIAYLVIRDDNGNLLLNIDANPNDLSFTMSTRPGEPITYVFPIFEEHLGHAPALEVAFENVVFGMNPLRYEAGSLTADVVQPFPADLSLLGIPFLVHKIMFGELRPGDVPGLFFSGELVLFEETLGGQGEMSLLVKENGTIEGNVHLPALNKEFQLVPGSDLAVLKLSSVQGQLSVPLLSNDYPWFDLGLAGSFLLRQGENSLEANLEAAYGRDGFTLTRFEVAQQISPEPPAFSLQPFVFQLNDIHSLSLDYNGGFDFYAHLDFSLGMHIGSETWMMQLQDVEIRPNGFVIPSQNLHENTTPPIHVPPLELHGFGLELLALRTERVTVNIFDFHPGDLQGFIPHVDFALSFPHLEYNLPTLPDNALTFSDVAYQDGLLSGDVRFEPLVPPAFPVGGMTMRIHAIQASLYQDPADEESLRQGIAVGLEGYLTGMDLFESSEDCPETAVELSIVSGRGFSGSIEHLIPCGEIPLGPLSLSFGPSRLDFSYADQTQHALLQGSAELIIPRKEGEEPITVTADELSFDLINGSIEDGYIDIDKLFRWSYPVMAEEPFFHFDVMNARLDKEGLTLKGEGAVHVTEQWQVDIAFNDLLFSLDDFSIQDGQAVIGSELAFELLFSPPAWKMVAPSDPLPENTTAIRLNMEDIGLVLDKDGLAFTGESSADFQWAHGLSENGDPYDDGGDSSGGPNSPDASADNPDGVRIFQDLQLVFEDGFRVGFNPMRALQGAAKLYQEEDPDGNGEPRLLAWYDSNGLNVGDILGVMPIPDILGLPDQRIAYMVLRKDGILKVETGTAPTGERFLRTREGKQVQIVIPTLESVDGDPLRFLTSFDVFVNAEWQPVSGSIEVSLEEPYQVSGFPLLINGLTYQRSEGTPVLTASAALKLPASLQDLEIVFPELRFGTDGFQRLTARIGDEDHDPAAPPETPAFQHSFGEDAFIVQVHYAEAAFGDENHFKMLGAFQSRFFVDKESDMPNNIPFSASYHEGDWSFGIDMKYLISDTLHIGYASLWLSEAIQLAVTEEAMSVSVSGVMSLPHLLGEDFGVSLEGLKISTADPYISVEEIGTDPGTQAFSLFDDKVKGSITSLSAALDTDIPALTISMSGSMSLFDLPGVTFENLTIGTDGSFSVDNELFISLLDAEDENIVIIDGYLEIEQVRFGLKPDPSEGENGRLHLALDLGMQTKVPLPSPFDLDASFNVLLVERGADGVDIIIEGPDFDIPGGFAIDANRPQFRLGQFATIDLRGLGLDLDLDDLMASEIYASVAIYLENNTQKRIEIGNVHDPQELRQQWGIRLSYDNGPRVQWGTVNLVAPPGEEWISLDLHVLHFSVMSMEVHQPQHANETFSIELGGRAGFALPQISGQADYEGFTFSANGIEQRGRLLPPAEFRLLEDRAILELGTFRWFAMEEGGAPLTLDFMRYDSDTFEEVAVSKEVTHYLHFTGAPSDAGRDDDSHPPSDAGRDDDPHALYISIPDANIDGGVREVFFYRAYNSNELYLKIDGLSFNLALDQMGLESSIDLLYIREESRYHFEGWGSGILKNPFGEDRGLNIAGKISTLGHQNNHVSWGFFGHVMMPIPIYPGVIDMTDVGAGFFWRPRASDIARVYDMVGFELQDPEEMAHLENMLTSGGGANQLLFAAFQTGGVGLLGAEGIYIMRGNALLQITEQYMRCDLLAVIFPEQFIELGFLGENYSFDDLMPLYAGGNVLIDWSRNVLHGGVRMGINIPYLIEEEENYNFAIQLASNPDWAIWGGKETQFLRFFDSHGDFYIGPSGFYYDATITGELKAYSVEVGGEFGYGIWWDRDHSFGGYGELDVYIRIPMMGLVGGDGYAALLHEQGDGFLFFAMGRVYKEVAWGTVGFDGWIAAETNPWRVSAGLFEDEEMADYVNRAGSRRDEIAGRTQKLVDDLQDIIDQVVLVYQTEEDLTSAGLGVQDRLNYLSYSPSFGWGFLFALRKHAFEQLKNKEVALHGHLPASYEWVLANVIDEETIYALRPDAGRFLQAREEMELLVEDIETRADQLADHITFIEGQAIQWREEAWVMASDLELAGHPVETTTVSVGDEDIPAFSFTSEAAKVRPKMEKVLGDVKQLKNAHEEVIEAILSNIEALEDMLLEEGELSLFGYADSMAETLESIGKYFGELSRYCWSYASWAERTHQGLNDPVLVSGINLDITNEKTRVLNIYTSQQADAIDAIYDLAYRRYYLMRLFAGSESVIEDAQAAVQELWEQPTNQGVADQLGLWAHDLYFNIHNLGLPALQQAYQALAEGLSESYPDILQMDPHGALTEDLDHLFMIKADLLTILHGVVEKYLSMLDEADDKRAYYEGMLAQITTALEAPVITSIQAAQISERVRVGTAMVTTDTGDQTPWPVFGDRLQPATSLTWGSSHPVGVVESSVSVIRDGGLSIHEHDPLLTLGQRNQWTYYGIKEDAGDMSHQYSFALRERGSGGRTSSRAVQFEMAVDQQGTYTSPGINILPDVTSKPSPPVIEFPYRKRELSVYNPITGMVTHYTGNYWTADPSRIQMTLSSYDEMVDVVQFEFSAGSAPGDRDILDWTVAQGHHVHVDPGGSSHQGTAFQTTMRNLQMTHNEPVYVSARAKNSAGNYSDVPLRIIPVRYDATPPEPPQATGDPMHPENGSGNQTTIRSGNLLTGEPSYPWTGAFNAPPTGRTPAEIALSWGTGEDPESGIYRYKVTSHPLPIGNIADVWPAPPPNADHLYTPDLSLTLRGKQLSYFDTLDIRVYAENYAGLLSEEPLELTSVVARDPTPPSYPTAAVWVRPEGVRTYITCLSVDRETHVLGYQYSVGNAPGQDNVISWPEGISLVQEAQMGVSEPPATPPYYLIPHEKALKAFPKNTELYINVRAVNGQGMLSHVYSTGPFVYEAVPGTPVVSIAYTRMTEIITIDQILGQGLPIAEVSIRRVNPTNGQVLKDWTSVADFEPGMHKDPTSLVLVNMLPEWDRTPVRIDVRVTNTAGRHSQGSDTWMPRIQTNNTRQ